MLSLPACASRMQHARLPDMLAVTGQVHEAPSPADNGR